jgi:hypothetical protein
MLRFRRADSPNPVDFPLDNQMLAYFHLFNSQSAENVMGNFARRLR